MPSKGIGKSMTQNVAVVGAGYWGKNLVRNFHALNALGAICDSDPERLESFKQQYPSAKMFNAYSDVLNDATIHAVAIATPAEAHADAVREALLAGKDVFVERSEERRVGKECA